MQENEMQKEEQVEDTETIDSGQAVDDVEATNDSNVDDDTSIDDLEDQQLEEELDAKEKARRAHYAELKRQQKAQKKAQEQTQTQEGETVGDEAMEAPTKDSNVNVFTGLAIEDEEDRKEYLEMLEAHSKGFNPKDITSMAKFRKEQRMANNVKSLESEAQKAKSIEEQNKFIQEDRAKFITTYPDVDLNELINDPNFQKYSRGKVGKESLVDIYSEYNEIISQHSQAVEDAKNDALARVKSSPGSMGNGESHTPSKPLTKSDYDDWITRKKSGKK